MTEFEIAKILKRKLRKSQKEFGNNLVGDIYNIFNYPISESKDFSSLKEECRKLNFYIDYVCDTPDYRSDIQKTRKTVIVYESKKSFT